MSALLRAAARAALSADLAGAACGRGIALQAWAAPFAAVHAAGRWPPHLRHYAATPTPDPAESIRRAERMVELMASSPQMQQMMLNMLPAMMRRPEVVKQMFEDPAARKKIAEMIAKRGVPIPDHLLERMTPATMESTFTRASTMGLDPGKVMAKLMSHPGLVAKLQDPRIMQAFLEIGQDPSAQAKYQDDKELLEVVFKVREILATERAAPAQAPPASPDPASAAPLPPSGGDPAIQLGAGADTAAQPGAAAGSSEAEGSSSSAQRVPPPPGQPAAAQGEGQEPAGAAGEAAGAAGGEINPLVALMSSDPKAAQWLDNPRVMQALQDVSKSPWKTVKYVFDREVMAAFQDLKTLMQGKKP